MKDMSIDVYERRPVYLHAIIKDDELKIHKGRR